MVTLLKIKHSNNFTIIIFSAFLINLCFASCQNQSLERIDDKIFINNFYKENPDKKRAYEFIINNLEGLKHVRPPGIMQDDIDSLSREFLINNVESSFKSSERLIQLGLISEEEFKEFVLPYRLNSSRIHDWRKTVMEKYNINNYGVINNEFDLINICNGINLELKSWFKFGSIDFVEDTLSYNDLLINKKGTCISMSYLSAYIYRGLGIPVSIDLVPAWGNLNGGHMWNSLVLRNNKFYPFQSAETNISDFEPFYLVKYGKLSTYKKPAKVYRQMYSADRQSVLYRYFDELPIIGLSHRMKDVTKSYIETRDISFDDNELGINPKINFINVFNNGKWVPVMATTNTNNKYIFKDMGLDLLYCLSSFDNRKYPIFDRVFFLNKKGNVRIINPNYKNKENIVLSKIRSKELDQIDELKNGWHSENLFRISEGLKYSKPISDKEYRLYYWENKWILAGKEKPNDGILTFRGIPSNALYLVTEYNPTPHERPFILNGGAIKWL